MENTNFLAIIHTTVKHNLPPLSNNTNSSEAITAAVDIRDEAMNDIASASAGAGAGADADADADNNYYLENPPKGMRFRPKDEDLIIHFLMKKISNQKLLLKINVVKFYSYDPDCLSDCFRPLDNNTWYFFTHPYKITNRLGAQSRICRIVRGEGYWKRNDACKPIVFSGQDIGCRRSLQYYRGRAACRGSQTNWCMRELTLNTTTQNIRPDGWVLVKLYKKTNSSRMTNRQVESEIEDAAAELNSLYI